MKHLSSQFDLLDTRTSVLKILPKAFREKSYKSFAQSPRIKTKNWFFRKKVAGIFLLDTWIVVLNSTENHSAKLKKIEFSSKLCFLSESSPRHRRSRCDNSTQCFCSNSKHGENLKTVSFSLLFPQNVPLEMMNANLTTLPISFEVAKEFHIMCGNDKKLWFSRRGSTFQHCCTGHVKALWPSCQKFCAQIQKQVTFVKVFEKSFSSESSSGRVKVIFDRLAETTFAKGYIRLLLKVRNWQKSLNFP